MEKNSNNKKVENINALLNGNFGSANPNIAILKDENIDDNFKRQIAMKIIKDDIEENMSDISFEDIIENRKIVLKDAANIIQYSREKQGYKTFGDIGNMLDSYFRFLIRNKIKVPVGHSYSCDLEYKEIKMKSGGSYYIKKYIVCGEFLEDEIVITIKDNGYKTDDNGKIVVRMGDV